MQHLDLKFRVKSADAVQGTFSGLGAAFGNVDSYGHVIDRGAFAKTLQAAKQRKQQSGTNVLWPLCWMHDENNPVGSIIAARETMDGLAIDCQYDLDTQAGREAFSRITKGYAAELSIGYRATRAVEGLDGNKHLTEIDLYEISVITAGHAANPRAQVDMASIKSRKGNNMQRDDWRQQRLPWAPQQRAPLTPVMPERKSFVTVEEYETAMRSWFSEAYGVEPNATRRVFHKDHKAFVSLQALNNGSVHRLDTDLVEVAFPVSGAEERAQTLAQTADERACLPSASVAEVKAYYARHGQTPDGRVIEDYGEAAQRGHEAALRLMADARKGQ